MRFAGGSVEQLTDHAELVQPRPPPPVDAVASIAMSEHEPTRSGATKTAAGTSGVSGTSSTVDDALMSGQQVQSVYAQYAYQPPR